MALLNWPCKTLCSLPCQWKARAKSTTTDQQHQGMEFIFCVYFKCVSVFLPAVCHYRPSIRGVEELDLTYESKQSGGVTWNAMVGPAGEMKLTEFADLMMGLLNNTHRNDVTLKLHILWWQLLKVTAILSRDDDKYMNVTGFYHGPYGKDWQEDISWFSRLIYSRHFRKLGAMRAPWLQMENKLISWMSRWHFGPLQGIRDRKT